MLPNFLIIGAPRAGTTWIAKNLRSHPDVYMPERKELHFFDRDYHLGMGYYERFFDARDGSIAVGEATPAYFFHPEAPNRIASHMPRARLIVSLRNPVERLYSRYLNSKSKYLENRKLSFEEKLRRKPLFIAEGFYYDHITRYLEYFDRNQLLILIYEDIQRNPSRFLRKVFLFLGIESKFRAPFLEYKINSARSKPHVGRTMMLSYLQEVARVLGFMGLADWIRYVNEVAPHIDPSTREWLVNEVYLEQNRKLEQLLGIDLSVWK